MTTSSAGAAAILLLGLTAGAPAAPAQECWGLDPASGYPVSAVAPEDADVDAAWLHDVARIAAYRWRVPTARRDRYEEWPRVRRWSVPPEPRWAPDWRPNGHRAAIHLTFLPDGRVEGGVTDASGDDAFDETLTSILDDPLPGAPAWPGLPGARSEQPVSVELYLGIEPRRAPRGLVHFAAEQTPVELQRETLQIDMPPDRDRRPVTVKFDVLADGRVEIGSVEFLRLTTPDVQQAVLDGLLRARFHPATSNCEPIALTMVQGFTRSRR